MNMTALVTKATEKYNGISGVASVVLANGDQLYCSVRNRASNSRGKRVGRHTVTTWHHRLATEQYSKQCSAQTAKELLEQHGV